MTEILLTSGYTDIADVHNGDQCAAYDISGNPVTNTIENIDEWRNVGGQIWAWTKETGAEIGPQGGEWQWLLVNGTATLFVAQSIWRMPAGGAILANPINVCHASDLEVGDTYYDGSDNPVVITSIADTTGPDVWYRFDVSGDHGYIADDVSLHNASRFWVGNGGTWDLSATTHWASSTGGSSGASAPGSADSATIDANSGTGTVTPNYGGVGTFQSITCGAMGMTLDFSVNNNSVTLTVGSSFSGTGTGTRTINLGGGTFTFTSTAAGTRWNMTTTTNLTFNANSSSLVFSGAITGSLAFGGGGLTYNAVTFGAINGGNYAIAGANTFATLTVTGPNLVTIPFGTTQTVTTLALNGSSGAAILFQSATIQSTATISVASNAPTLTWCGFRDITATGGAIFAASSSEDYGHNSGITITPPAAGGGSGNSGGYIIGS